MSEQTIYIQVVRDGQVLRTDNFSSDNIIVGSGPAAHLRLEDELVARMHAMIKLDSGNYVLSDSGWSEDGTILNQSRLTGDSVLSNGDEILVGSTILRFFTAAPMTERPDASTEVSSISAEWKAEIASKSTSSAVLPRVASQEALAVSRDPMEVHLPEESAPEVSSRQSLPVAPAFLGSNPSIEKVSLAEPEETYVPEVLPESFFDGMIEDDQSRGKTNIQIVFSWNGITQDIGTFDSPRVVTMGQHPLNDFSFTSDVVPENKNYPILVPYNKSFGVFVTPEFKGRFVGSDGSSVELSQALGQGTSKTISGIAGTILGINENEEWHLELENLQIQVKTVYPTQKKVLTVSQEKDFLFLRLTLFSFVLHLALVLMFQFVPLDTYSLGESTTRRTRFQVEPPPQVVRKAKEEFKVKKEEKKIEKVKETTKEKVQKDAPTDQRPSDKQRVKKSGLLGLLSSGMGDMGAGGDLFGKANQQQFLGKLLGASSGGTAFGMGGLTGRGFGSGGGGGSGMYGGGGGWGYGGRKRVYGRNGMSLRGKGRSKTIVRINPGRLILKGALTKAQIAKVIRMYWAQIKFCYERQLMSNPKLGGKIIIRWVIGGDGTVQSASVAQTTMNNERVENCITRKIQRWRFPIPKGGGQVRVNYPFVFRSTS